MTVHSKLHILGSSSKGNGYILEVGDDILIIECGFRLREVYRKINFEARKIRAVIVSHNHGDHAKYIHEYIAQGFPIMCPHSMVEELNIPKSQIINEYNPFTVVPFELHHDVPCVGFLVYHPEFGKLLFATDTYMIPYRFDDIRLAIIEANWYVKIMNNNLANGSISRMHADRVRMTHMELPQSIGALKRIDKLERVLLIHLSSQNSDADEFQRMAKSALGVPIDVAQPNMTIEL